MSETSLVVVERIGVALLHSLWQGALVGLALFILLIALRRSTANCRYLACWFALALMLLLPFGTYVTVPVQSPIAAAGFEGRPTLISTAAAVLETAVRFVPADASSIEPAPAQAADASGKPAKASASVADGRWLSPRATSLLVALVAAWVTGVVFLSLRMLGGYALAWRLTRRFVQPLDEIWQSRFQQLVVRLGVRGPVEIWQSACVDVPAVIGCFRPVVLVPAALMTGLPPTQLEAIFAHELAHIRRHDFLANAVQCAIETLLFYHPCVWWISSRLRAEREHCCDEFAVAACGDAVVYARALADLDQWRAPARPALAFTGGGPLLARVRRIVGVHRSGDVVGGWLAGTLAILVPLAIGGTWAWSRTVAVGNAQPAVAREVAEPQAVPVQPTPADQPVITPDLDAEASGQPFDGMPLRLMALPPSPFGGPREGTLARTFEEYGPELVVKVVVIGLRGDVHQQVYDRLRGMLPNLSYFGSGRGDTAAIQLAPVSDLDDFAARIDFGDVRSIDHDQRVITVVADLARMPRPTSPVTETDGDLDSDDIIALCERLAVRDRRAIERLIDMGSAAEVEVAKYTSDADRRVRRAALLVLKRIATERSLPPLFSALDDADVGCRDLAWQTICRMPRLLQRTVVVKAAINALDRDLQESVKWLTAIGPAAEPQLLDHLTQADAQQRLAIIQTLRLIGTRKCLPALERMANNPASPEAKAAATAREAVSRRAEL